jgi:hypothetical protein
MGRIGVTRACINRKVRRNRRLDAITAWSFARRDQLRRVGVAVAQIALRATAGDTRAGASNATSP